MSFVWGKFLTFYKNTNSLYFRDIISHKSIKMNTRNSILFSEKKKVFKYDSKDNNYEWVIEFNYKVSGLSRVENYVFVTTYSNWGISYSHIIDFQKGEILWEIEDVFYSVHIVGKTLIFYNKKKYFTGVDIDSGKEIFKIKSPFRWSSPKVILLNGKYNIYSSKKVYILDLKNGNISDSKLPKKFNPKEVSLVLDEFQININNIPSAGGDYGSFYGGDTGGGDSGGGDGGGGE